MVVGSLELELEDVLSSRGGHLEEEEEVMVIVTRRGRGEREEVVLGRRTSS